MYTLIPNPEQESQLILHENGIPKHCPFQNAYGMQNNFGKTQLVKHPCESTCALFKSEIYEPQEIPGAAPDEGPQPTYLIVTQHCTPNDATYKVELVEPHTETFKLINK